MPGPSSGGLTDSISPPSASTVFNSTSFLRFKLYIVVLGTLAALSCASVLLLLCFRRIIRGRQGSRVLLKQTSGKTPLVSKHTEDSRVGSAKRIEVVAIMVGDGGKGSGGSNRSRSSSSASVVSVEVQNVGWGRWYSLKELEAATRGFSEENVVGEGGFGIVYRGVLEDGSVVAVKNLLNNRGQAEKEFEGEVEAIGRVRHKNLVGLFGYCAEGATRMLVYEYVEHGNLGQWLHGEVGDVSPLTWDIRVKIAIGTAKGGIRARFEFEFAGVGKSGSVGAMASGLQTFEIPLFDGKTNFTLWQSTIQDLLVQQGLDQALEEEKPVSMSEREWSRLQKKAVSTIRLALAPQIKFGVLKGTTPKALWEKLESIYASKSLTNRLCLKMELYSLKMEEGGNLHDHINSFNQLVCQLSNADDNIKEEEQALLLLASLPRSYKPLVQMLLVGRKTLTKDEVTTALRESERMMLPARERIAY